MELNWVEWENERERERNGVVSVVGYINGLDVFGWFAAIHKHDFVVEFVQFSRHQGGEAYSSCDDDVKKAPRHTALFEVSKIQNTWNANCNSLIYKYTC